MRNKKKKSQFLISLFFFLTMLHNMWDLSSLTGDRTHGPALESLTCETPREVPAHLDKVYQGRKSGLLGERFGGGFV